MENSNPSLLNSIRGILFYSFSHVFEGPKTDHKYILKLTKEKFDILQQEISSSFEESGLVISGHTEGQIYETYVIPFIGTINIEITDKEEFSITKIK